MLKLLVRKWWVVLLQGMVMLLLSFYIFRNPATVLTSLSIWLGLLVMISGVIGFFSSFGNDKSEPKGFLILWSLVAMVFGFLLLTNILVTMKAITLVFGLWMLAGTLRFLAAGWVIKSENSLGWIVILTGALSLIAAVMVMTDLGTAAFGISVLLGTQVLISAIALIILAIVKKKVSSALHHKIESLKRT
ncbi:MAG TPA: DUF308 domain-containing protein [Saprospiraceae bacterium]|nr:DUF308 domain-containing protein [Saprospiraceae bacterium]